MHTPGQTVQQSHSEKKLQQQRPQLACLISTNIYATSCSSSLSVFFVPNTCHLSGCLCRWCQTVTATVSNRRGKNFHFTLQQWEKGALSEIMVKIKSIHFVISAPLLFSMVETNVNPYFFIKLLECSQARLQTFHFTIRTGSTNNGFALCPRFAGTKFVCNFSFLLSTGILKQHPGSRLNSTLPKQYPKQHPKIQPWHQAPPL